MILILSFFVLWKWVDNSLQPENLDFLLLRVRLTCSNIKQELDITNSTLLQKIIISILSLSVHM